MAVSIAPHAIASPTLAGEADLDTEILILRGLALPEVTMSLREA